MTDKEIMDKYNALMKKFNLPSFDELDSEFGIGKIEGERFILKHIVKQIRESLEQFSTILEEILQPESTVSYMREYNNFSETERKRVYDLYSRVKYHHRLSLEVHIENKEALHAEFIKSLLNVYPKMKGDMLWVIKKMKAAWEKGVDVKQDLAYMG